MNANSGEIILCLNLRVFYVRSDIKIMRVMY